MDRLQKGFIREKEFLSVRLLATGFDWPEVILCGLTGH